MNRQSLEESGDLEKMLNYGKSDMVAIVPNIGGERLEMDARLSFKEMPDGSIALMPQTIRQEPKLDGEFMGHSFLDFFKSNLNIFFHISLFLDFSVQLTCYLFPAFIFLYLNTSHLAALSFTFLPIPTKIG